MSRGVRIWLVVGVLLLGGVAFLLIRGSIEPAGIWLDGEPDPASREIAIFIVGRCDGELEEVKSLSIEESEVAVIVDLKVRVPFHIWGRDAGPSCEGMPYVLHLEQPVADREILRVNPDGSTWPIQVNPF